MIRFFILLIGVLVFSSSFCQTVTEKEIETEAIKQVMAAQEKAWNLGDIEKFMDGYWKSDRLCFIGRSGLTTGWQSTLDGYRKSYPGKEGMGSLRFEIISTDLVSEEVALLIGKYFLKRNDKEDSGIFSLTWKKMPEGWKIIADHTSSFSK